MRFLGLVLRRVSRISTHIGAFFHQVTELLNNVLPAILPPAELTRLIQSYYDYGYRGAADYSAREFHGTGLSTWEKTVLTQYNIKRGTIIVLGAGVGREAIEFARKDLRVIGVDTNREALRLAVRTTQEERLSALFVQANFSFFNQLDTNNDGKVTLAEFQLWREAHFDALDTNKDGSLSRQEVSAGNTRFSRLIGQNFDPIDTNQDQRLSREEFRAAGRRRFLILDADRDGYLTPQELAKAGQD